MFVSHVDLAFENDKMDGCFTSVTTVHAFRFFLRTRNCFVLE